MAGPPQQQARVDGRPANTTIRPLSCELGTLTSCDGSADWKSGHTSVLAAVHGPIAPRMSQFEDAAQSTVSVVIQSGISNSSNNKNAGIEREWEGFLSRLFGSYVTLTSAHPRSTINIVLQVLHSDGSVLGACIHAAVAALLDAGIEMKVLPVAVTCGVTEDGNFFLDPVTGEDDRHIVLILDAQSQFLSCHSSASLRIRKEGLVSCHQLAERAVPAVRAFFRMVMEQKSTRESQTLWSLAPK